jgi:hypothetical protein
MTCAEHQSGGRKNEAQTPHDIMVAAQEELSKDLIRRLTRKCPGSGCGVPIMQDLTVNGCDKMKCK